MRKKLLTIIAVFLVGTLFPLQTVGQDSVVWWTFDKVNAQGIAAVSGNHTDPLEGYWENPVGVKGKCLKLDGYTTRLTREVAAVPVLEDALTIECWIALQSLPWNWSAIVSQGLLPEPVTGRSDFSTGGSGQTGQQSPDPMFLEVNAPDQPGPQSSDPVFPVVSATDQPGPQYTDRIFFGVNAHGQPGFRLTLDGTTYECVAEKKIPLLKWNHLAATYEAGTGMKIFLNGEEVAHREVTGELSDDPSTDMLIGMNINKLGPEGSERQASADIGSRMVLHGLLDELKIYDWSVPGERLSEHYREELPKTVQPLHWTQLPSGPEDLPAGFDAIHTRLNYTSEWEAQWNVGGFPDILVHFDRLPVRFIFWRGTGYGGVWVTENGLWMADQSLERSNAGKSPMGCSEHMSDKHTRYSRVRIIEKNDARIVIQWRYAISDILYDIFGINEENPRGEWADEYYYIYPDGVTTRHQVLWTGYLSHEWQETIVINHPGTSPDDHIDLEAMTLLNMKGASRTYSWREGGPAAFPEPPDANIQMVNLKSAYKPYIIFEPHPGIRPFNRSTIRPEYAHFPWWNHWPVAQVPNDGRRAFGPDRPSHSSLSQSVEGSEVIHKMEDGSFEVMTLIGMTNLPADSLVPLARSWNHPPELTIAIQGFLANGYSKQQRAYIIEKGDMDAGELTFSIQASEQSPLVHPCIVIENWGAHEIQLAFNGVQAAPGSFCYGFRNTPLGTDLVVWTGLRSEQPAEFSIVPLQ